MENRTLHLDQEINLLSATDHLGNKINFAVLNYDSLFKKDPSSQLQNIPFRPAKTFESIAIFNYSLKRKREAKIPDYFVMGDIVKTEEGIFTNTTETDNIKLNQLLNNAKKINGIYFINDEIAFAPYDSFDYHDPFFKTSEGLARALEHTESSANNLDEICKNLNSSRGTKTENLSPIKGKPISQKIYFQGSIRIPFWGYENCVSAVSNKEHFLNWFPVFGIVD